MESTRWILHFFACEVLRFCRICGMDSVSWDFGFCVAESRVDSVSLDSRFCGFAESLVD